MKRVKIPFVVLLVLSRLLFFPADGRLVFEAAAAQAEGQPATDREPTQDTVFPTDNFPESVENELNEIDRFLQEEFSLTQMEVSFSDLVRELMSGNSREAGHLLARLASSALFDEIGQGARMARTLLVLGMLGAVFTAFSDVFSANSVSGSGERMVYLLSFALLASAFFESMDIADSVLRRQTEFMRALVPAWFLTVAWSGAGAAAAGWLELLFFLIAAVEWMYLNLLMPLIRLYVLVVLVGNMARENLLSHFAELMYTVIAWGGRSLFGVVLGFQMIQGMVLPYADAVRTAGVRKLLGAIPGIGAGAEAVTKLMLGSGVLIKNTVGAAAVVVLLVLSVVPLLKLSLLWLFYRIVAALLQPVADRRLVACIVGAAAGQKLLLMLAAAGLLLFLLTIALICAGTNVVYL